MSVTLSVGWAAIRASLVVSVLDLLCWLPLGNLVLLVEGVDILLTVKVNGSFSGLGEDKLEVSLLTEVVNGLEDIEDELLVGIVEGLNLSVGNSDKSSDGIVELSVGGINLSSLHDSSLDDSLLESGDLSLSSGNDLGNGTSVGLSLGLVELSPSLSEGEDISVPELVGSEHGLSDITSVVVVVKILKSSLVSLSVSVSVILLGWGWGSVVLVGVLLLVEFPNLVELSSDLVLSVGKLSLESVSLVIEVVSEELLSPKIGVPILSLVLGHTGIDISSSSDGGKVSLGLGWEGSVEDLSLSLGPVENLGWSKVLVGSLGVKRLSSLLLVVRSVVDSWLCVISVHDEFRLFLIKISPCTLR